jgi:hypothetical protein
MQGIFGVVQETFNVIQGMFSVIQGTFGLLQGTFGFYRWWWISSIAGDIGSTNIKNESK